MSELDSVKVEQALGSGQTPPRAEGDKSKSGTIDNKEGKPWRAKRRVTKGLVSNL
jgi:hypothetical protein